MSKFYTLIYAFFFTGLAAFAQDPIYNQFYNAPLFTNPASTGAFEGRWRAGINYRNAWSLPLSGYPFSSVGASFDMRFKAVKRDYFSLGFNFLNDRAGEQGFTINRGNLSASYQKQLNGQYGGYDSYLILGVQAGFGKHTLSDGNYWVYDQFDPTNNTILPQSPNFNNAGDASELYLNANLGLMWYAVFDDKQSIYVGGSYFHLNEPDIGFLDNKIPLDARLLAHIGGELPLGKSLSLMPALMYTTQGPYFQLQPGFNIRYNNQYFRELAIRAGVWMRYTNNLDQKYVESIIPSFMFEYESWLIGLSYEINRSPITAINNGRGGVELSFYYINDDHNFRNPIKCPKF